LDLHKIIGFFPTAELIKIMQTGVTSPLPESLSRVYRGRGMRGVGGHALKLLFVGQVEAHKGIAWLVSVWLEIRQELKNATLTVVGDGSLRHQLQTQTSSDPTIIWRGHLSASDVSAEMHSHDVLVVPSLCYENLPTVITEAYKVGLPVVGSRLGGIPEIVPVEMTFTPGSVENLVSVLEAFTIQ
jgi:glycosyltransferase involved in cell wall biosynthesis